MVTVLVATTLLFFDTRFVSCYYLLELRPMVTVLVATTLL